MSSAPPTTAPPGSEAEQQLLEKYSVLERRLDALVRDVHLPFLDVELYKKYFLSIKSVQRLEHLGVVVDALSSHRLSTLRILKLSLEREEVFAKIIKIAEELAAKRIQTLDAQTQVLQQLYFHQQVTLKIVENVFAWREQLTRPYPFQFKGQDYFTKILADCEFMDSCTLRSVLPLRIAEFPLCSNVASIKMFAPKEVAGGAAAGAGSKKTNPIDVQKQQREAERLRNAESMLFAEKKLQQKVVRELQSLASQSKFVTLLSLPRIIPNCGTGIPITNDDWITQLRDAIDEAVHRVDEPPQQQQQASTNTASPRRASSPSSSEDQSLAVPDSARSTATSTVSSRRDEGTAAPKVVKAAAPPPAASASGSEPSTPPQQPAGSETYREDSSDFEEEED